MKAHPARRQYNTSPDERNLPQPSSPLPSHPPTYPVPPNQPPKVGFFNKKVTLAQWLLILLIIAGIGFGYMAGYSGAKTNQIVSTSNDTSQNLSSANNLQDNAVPTDVPTAIPTPTQPLKWTTVQTFTGNGSKKTAIFTMPDDWKIIWSCNPSSSFGGEYNVIVSVDNSDGSSLDPVAVNTICQSGNTSDSTEEHQGGDVYLDINSEGAWTIQVQVLK